MLVVLWFFLKEKFVIGENWPDISCPVGFICAWERAGPGFVDVDVHSAVAFQEFVSNLVR